MAYRGRKRFTIPRRADDQSLSRRERQRFREEHLRDPQRLQTSRNCSNTETEYRTDERDCPWYATDRDERGCCVFRPDFGNRTVGYTNTRDEKFLHMLRKIVDSRQVLYDSPFIPWVMHKVPNIYLAELGDDTPTITIDDERVDQIRELVLKLAPERLSISVVVPSATATPHRFTFLDHFHGGSHYNGPGYNDMGLLDAWDMGTEMLKNWDRKPQFSDLDINYRATGQPRFRVIMEDLTLVIPSSYGYDREKCFLNILLSVHELCIFEEGKTRECSVFVQHYRTNVGANVPGTHKRLLSDGKEEAMEVMRRLKLLILQNANETLIETRSTEMDFFSNEVSVEVESKNLTESDGFPVCFKVIIYPMIYIKRIIPVPRLHINARRSLITASRRWLARRARAPEN